MWSYGDESVRDLWSLDPNISFLNHGSYGAVPRAVREAYFSIHSKIEQNPVAFLSRELPEKLSNVRDVVARWLNCDPQGMAFVSNATSGVGSVLSSMSFAEGDEIVFHNHGYGWVRQGLANLAAKTGAIIREAQIPVIPRSDTDIVNSFAQVLSHRTKLLICDHVTSPTALIFPVKEIVALASASGVPVLIDGAHAPAFLPLDLAHLGVDFYTGNFHKWLCAPRGAAFLYVADRWRDIIRPQSLSYSGGVTHHHYDSSFTGFFDWTGTNNFASWLTIPEAMKFHEELGWPRVFGQREKFRIESGDLFLRTLEHSGYELPDSHFLGAMLLLPWRIRPEVQLSNALARELTRELYEQSRVEIPVIYFEKQLYVRLSAQIYNHTRDVERLIEALGAHPFSRVRIGDG